MSTESDIREFLASRRAKITPQQAGLPAFGGNRRVPGLRREEVAMLAGVSIDYYVRLERGIRPAPPRRSSTPSRAPSGSTTPSARTCTTSRAPPRSGPLYADVSRHPVNIARFQFLDPAGRDFLPLDFDATELPARPGPTLTAYSTAPNTPDHDKLRLLAAWTATPETAVEQ